MSEYTGANYIPQPIQSALDGKLSNPANTSLDMQGLDIFNGASITTNNIILTTTSGNAIVFPDGSIQDTAGGGGGGGTGGAGGPAGSVQYNNGFNGSTGSANLLYVDAGASGTLTLNGAFNFLGTSIAIGATGVGATGEAWAPISNQGVYAVALGSLAGQSSQGNYSVAIGAGAGNDNQGYNAVVIGAGAGYNKQGANAVAIGSLAGRTSQRDFSVALGFSAGQFDQSGNAVAIGYQAGLSNQQCNAVAIGYKAGQIRQQSNAIALGNLAGRTSQQAYAIAIGESAGQTGQQANAIAIGLTAGGRNQQSNTIAIGSNAGQSNQQASAIAIGQNAGQTGQGVNAVALGTLAGQSNQHANSIVINSTGLDLPSNGANTLTIKSIRGVTGTAPPVGFLPLYYNTTSSEVVSVPVDPIGPTGYTGPIGPTGPVGATGPIGPTGPSISWVGGDTGPYDTTPLTIDNSATRMNEHAFQVSGPSNIFLIHYNLILSSGGDNKQITSTIGIASSASATAATSTNLYDGLVNITLNGSNANKYIAASHGNISGTDAANLIGHATVTNLTAGTYYATVWAAATGVTTLVGPTVNLVVLQIK